MSGCGSMRRACNVEFRRPLPVDEVDKLALSVSTWVWSGGGPAHHGMWTQEDRRLGGLTWGRMRRYDNRERDRAVVRAARGGMSKRAIARQLGLTEGTIPSHFAACPRAGCVMCYFTGFYFGVGFLSLA